MGCLEPLPCNAVAVCRARERFVPRRPPGPQGLPQADPNRTRACERVQCEGKSPACPASVPERPGRPPPLQPGLSQDVAAARGAADDSVRPNVGAGRCMPARAQVSPRFTDRSKFAPPKYAAPAIAAPDRPRGGGGARSVFFEARRSSSEAQEKEERLSATAGRSGNAGQQHLGARPLRVRAPQEAPGFGTISNRRWPSGAAGCNAPKSAGVALKAIRSDSCRAASPGTQVNQDSVSSTVRSWMNTRTSKPRSAAPPTRSSVSSRSTDPERRVGTNPWCT